MDFEPALSFRFALADLGRIRRAVASAAVRSGLPRSRADDFALAVNEIACNAIVHGRPPATFRIWRGDGELVCQVADRGAGINDHLVGRRRPPADGIGGRGIWLARKLCDAVEIRNRGGCTVSLRAAAPS